MIDRYLAEIESHLKALRPLIAHEALTVERPEGITLAYLKGRITFIDGSQLALAEIISLSMVAYRFHYMDRHHRLIFRWDSAPHHRHLKTYPFHLHTAHGLVESPRVNVPAVLLTIQAHLTQHLGQS